MVSQSICLLPGDGRQIVFGEYPAVSCHTHSEVRQTEGSGTFLAPDSRKCAGGPGGFSVCWSFAVFGKSSVRCPRSRLSPAGQQPGHLGTADWLWIHLKLSSLSLHCPWESPSHPHPRTSTFVPWCSPGLEYTLPEYVLSFPWSLSKGTSEVSEPPSPSLRKIPLPLVCFPLA